VGYNRGVKSERIQLAGQTARIVERPDAKLTAILMHGFGAPGDDLVGLAPYLDAPVRFVFPEAPLTLGGLYGDSRAWWLLDLARLERELASGRPQDRRAEVPEGLADARAHVLRIVDEVKTRFAIDESQLVLGGFSQGAMVALDVALHLPRPPRALVLMSGTLLAETVWQPRFATLAGVPVLMSHGTHDPLLPFSAAELLRDQLTAAGAKVDWIEFPGGHEIPPAVVDGASKFLRAL
jgi:phospholipase/carboxylesterase